MAKKVRIYSDEGASPACLVETKRSFEQILSGELYEVVYSSALEYPFLKLAEFNRSTGHTWGRSRPYHNKLGSRGFEHIREYVRGGGLYLGLCAGAYMGAKVTEFETGTSLEIIQTDGLGFYPGKAIGSAYHDRKFEYETESDSRLSEIQFSSYVSKFYFNGGCYFESCNDFEKVEVLGRYLDAPGLPACIVLCSYGHGKALLCGVHIEYSYRSLLPDSASNQLIYEELRANEPKRMDSFQYLIRDCLFGNF